MTNRVVVTGMAGICPLGSDWKTVSEGLRTGRSAVSVVEALGEYEGMDTRLGATVRDFQVPEHYPRKKTRSMGRVSLLATRATELALDDDWHDVPVRAFDRSVKAGVAEQVAAMMDGASAALLSPPTLEEAAELTRYAEAVFGYAER